jgi:cell division transport system permease protein
MEIFQFWLREAFSNVRRNRLMSLLAISTVTISLFILGAFYISLANLQAAVSNQTQQSKLVVFLDRDITPKRRKEIFDAARIKQVAKLEIVLASQALKRMGQEMNFPVSDLLDDNLLSDELHIELKNPADFLAVKSYLKSIKGVSKEDSESEEAARQILDLNRFLTWAAIASLLVLGVGILLIVSNAIRLTAFARRREIQLMALVGATTGFIRVPFLLEGMFYGIIGATIAGATLSISYLLLKSSSSEILHSVLPIAPASILGSCVMVLLLTGTFFGVVSAWFSFGSTQKSLN